MPADAAVMYWADGAGSAHAGEQWAKEGLPLINCPNGMAADTNNEAASGNFIESLSQEFEHDVRNLGTPGKGGVATNLSSSQLLGVQSNLWELGWGKGSVEFVPAAIARATAGWWGGAWPRNSSAALGGANATENFLAAYFNAEKRRRRLTPLCWAKSSE